MGRPGNRFDKLRAIGAGFRREVAVYRLVLKDPRTPRTAKWLLGLAVGYALLPFDLIPDFIPVIGHLDDIIIVPLLVILAVKRIPQDVINDCRARVTSDEAAQPTHDIPKR